MRRFCVFLLILGFIPAFALISPDLDAVIQQKELSDLIPIDIVLREQMDVQTLRSMVDRLPKVQKRVRVAEILRSFSAEKQASLLRYLREMQRQGKAADIAHVVLFLCSEMARQITGQVIRVDAGLPG